MIGAGSELGGDAPGIIAEGCMLVDKFVDDLLLNAGVATPLYLCLGTLISMFLS